MATINDADPRVASLPLDWTRIYKTCWDKVEDDSPISTPGANSKSSTVTANNTATEEFKVPSKDHDCNEPGCSMCSSKNRDAERRVAKMTTKERLKEMIHFRKDKGNVEFDRKCFSHALMWYEKSLVYYEYCFPENDVEEQILNDERKKCLLNAAACMLQLKLYKQCLEYCTEALELTNGCCSSTVKALFRRAKAHQYRHDYDDASKDLMKAKEIDKSLNGEHLRELDAELHRIQGEVDKENLEFGSFAQRMMRNS